MHEFYEDRGRRKQSFLPHALAVVSGGVLLLVAAGFLLSRADIADRAKLAQDSKNGRLALSGARQSIDNLRSGTVDTLPLASGHAGEAEAALRGYFAKIATDHQAYVGELKALGFPEFLKPQRLATENLSAVRAKLAQGVAIVQKYRTLSDTRANQFRDAVQNTDLTVEEKAEFQRGVDKVAGEAAAARARVWTDEESVLGEYQQVIGLLAQSRNQWEYRSGKLMFRNPATLRAFNDHLNNIRNYGEDEKVVAADARSSADQRIDTAIGENP